MNLKKTTQFGNSTAEGLPKSIKNKLEPILKNLQKKNKTLSTQQFKKWIINVNQKKQQEILSLLKLNNQTSIMEATSGTEADYIVNSIAEYIAQKYNKKQVINFIPKSNQIGSGGKKVTTDSHNSKNNCHQIAFGIQLNKKYNEKIQSDIKMVLKEYDAFNGKNMIKPKKLEKKLYNQIKKELKKGEVVRINLVSASKLGTSIGSPKFINKLLTLKNTYHNKLILVLDNCQRIYFDNQQIQKWIEKGVIILNTLSKADQAPPFYGFLLLGENNKKILNELNWNTNLNFYFSKHYCGKGLKKLQNKIDNQALDIGLFIRREAGLITLRKLQKITNQNFYKKVKEISLYIQNKIDECDQIELTLRDYHPNKYIVNHLSKILKPNAITNWYDFATRFPLRIKIKNKSLTKQEANLFRKFLNRDLSTIVNYMPTPAKKIIQATQREFLLGQAVEVNNEGFIRIAIGNRQIADTINNNLNLQNNIDQLFTKIDFIIEHWDLIREIL